MTAFPIFKKLSTAGYGLYPGDDARPDLDAEFQPGLTLVLGANGLGKTTLVTMLYRMCTGPADLPRWVLDGSGELGGKELRAVKLSPERRRLFGDRVHDGASKATATLEFDLGQSTILAERSLKDLDLLRLECNGQQLPADENSFQRLICERADLPSFVDWILILRHLTFYFEDRRSLVWDPSAQRQILRLLFLSQNTSKEWRSKERDVQKRDSRMRNFRYSVSTRESVLSESDEAVTGGATLRKELAKLERRQDTDQRKLEGLNDGIVEMADARERAQLEAIKAEDEHEATLRDLERQQLATIERAFPSSSDTARYLISQLIADEECMACGNNSPKAAATLKERIDGHRCVVCNSPVAHGGKGKRANPKAIAKTAKAVERAATRLGSADQRRTEANAEFDQLMSEIDRLKATVAKRRAEMDKLARELPPEDGELHERRVELTAARSQLESMKRDLANRRARFGRFVERTISTIQDHAEDVCDSFDSFAEDFLFEDCQLRWSPAKAQIGETGASIPFPAFQLEIGGADFDSPVKRKGPEQVSESQREFIDLSFRMALMQIAGDDGRGSLVVDAPESSLDAVFVKRAADVLIRFAQEPHNRVVITSNLIEGNLIPELIRLGGIKGESSERVIDLLKIAAPTAATHQWKSQYSEVRRDLFRRAKKKPKR